MNFSPLINDLIGILLSLAGVSVPVFTGFFIKKVGLEKDTALRDSLNTALTNSIGAALTYGQKLGDSKLSNVTIKNGALAAAVEYVIANAPDAIKHFGLTTQVITEKATNFLHKHLDATAPAEPEVPDVVPPAVFHGGLVG